MYELCKINPMRPIEWECLNAIELVCVSQLLCSCIFRVQTACGKYWIQNLDKSLAHTKRWIHTNAQQWKPREYSLYKKYTNHYSVSPFFLLYTKTLDVQIMQSAVDICRVSLCHICTYDSWVHIARESRSHSLAEDQQFKYSLLC